MSDKNQRMLRFRGIRSILTFLACAFFSSAAASAIGLQLWHWSGQTPDNSGGTLIFFYAAIISGIFGLVARIFTRNRAVLYGMTFFLWNTVLVMILTVFSST